MRAACAALAPGFENRHDLVIRLPACLPACQLVCACPAFLHALLPACLAACLRACLLACFRAFGRVCVRVCLLAFWPACLPAYLRAWSLACLPPACLHNCLLAHLLLYLCLQRHAAFSTRQVYSHMCNTRVTAPVPSIQAQTSARRHTALKTAAMQG